MAAYLRDIQIDTILISELQRAKQTAEYIRAPKLITITATRASMKCTSASGKCSITVKLPPVTRRTGETWMNDWLHAAPTGGEPFPQFAARVQAMADELRRGGIRNPATLLIVAHKGVLRLIITRWFAAFPQRPCGSSPVNRTVTVWRNAATDL